MFSRIEEVSLRQAPRAPVAIDTCTPEHMYKARSAEPYSTITHMRRVVPMFSRVQEVSLRQAPTVASVAVAYRTCTGACPPERLRPAAVCDGCRDKARSAELYNRTHAQCRAAHKPQPTRPENRTGDGEARRSL